MLVSRRPGAVGPPATRSYSPSMLFRWMPVPGTITPEPEPVDDESDAAVPSESTTDTWVVPAGAGSTSPGAPASIRAEAACDPLAGEQPPREPAAVQAAREALFAHARLLAHHLDERRDRLGAARRAVPGPREQRQAVGDQDPARRRRRIRDHLVPEIADAHRAAPGDAVVREIALGDRAAALAHRAHDRPRELAAIERRRALRGDLLERAAEIGQPQRVARAPAVSRPAGCRRAGPRRCGAGSGRGSRAGAPAGARARRRSARARSPARAGSRHGSRP